VAAPAWLLAVAEDELMCSEAMGLLSLLTRRGERRHASLVRIVASQQECASAVRPRVLEKSDYCLENKILTLCIPPLITHPPAA
jgi:hypothetical protein